MTASEEARSKAGPIACQGVGLAEVAAHLGIAYREDDALACDPALFDLISVADCHRLGVVPIARSGPDLQVAVSEPANLELEQHLTLMTGCDIEPVAATAEAIEAALKRIETTGEAMGDVSESFRFALVRETEGKARTIALEDLGTDAAPIVRLVNGIVQAALQRRASDVHIQSTGEGPVVHFRIDGVLLKMLGPIDPAHQAPLVSRIKVMAELDIAEHRIPQDGRFRLRLRRRDIDFRVSVLPGIHGEDMVIRILDKSHLVERGQPLTLESLGFVETDRQVLEATTRASSGMLLITGPTGSGKTTTLYACLGEIDTAAEKVITIEDPVEYELPGVLQIPVNEKKQLTFAAGLRSILRHDPDKIMVGEIRDRETASIAVQSALTGHLVFTTVHANNVFEVLARFTHMGVDHHAFVASLNVIVAQRLLRRVCVGCGTEKTFSADDLSALGLPMPDGPDATWREGAGCDACAGTGYRGRLVAAEILPLTSELRQLILERRPTAELLAAAQAGGFKTLREAALNQAAAGRTTLAEVVRVAG